MMRKTSRHFTAVRLYRALLVAYPRVFRVAYGMAMVQLFRDCCRETQGGRAWIALWLRTLADVVVTATQEHIAEGRKRMTARRGNLAFIGVALVLAVGVGYVNTHTDETGIIASCIVCTTLILGIARPRWAVWWLLLVGLSVPVSQMMTYLLGLHMPYPNSLLDIRNALLPAMICATVGAVPGFAMGWLRERRVSPTG